MLSICNLHKTIDRRPVLREVSFELAPGHAAGLIGRNGSGKTTLLKTIAGVLLPDRGSVEYEGRSVHAHPELKRDIVFVPDNAEAWFGNSAYGCAELYSHVYPHFDMNYFRRTIARLELPLNRNVRHFSKGMRMMLLTVLGLATKAKYVLLDEPTNGIDPIAKRQVLTLLAEASAEGTTLIISSHLLEELERLTDTILLLKEGRIEAQASDDVSGGRLVKLQVAFADEPPLDWLASGGVKVLDHIGRVYTVLVDQGEGSPAYDQLVRLRPLLMEPLPMRLEDLYLWKLGGAEHVG